MSHTAADLESAVAKLAAAGLTESEVDALAAALADAEEVAGFARPSGDPGWSIVESLRPGPGKGLLGDDLGILRGGSQGVYTPEFKK